MAEEKDIHTIFYQGTHCSQVQAARYLPDGFVSSESGERVRCSSDKCGFEGLVNYFPGPEIDEVVFPHDLDNQNETWPAYIKYLLTHKPFHIKCHLANWFSSTDIILPEDTETDKSVQTHFTDWSKMSFGQEGDMLNHVQKYDSLMSKNPDTDVVLWGTSRGAATTFNTLACYQDMYDLSKIKLAVLEGCYDSVQSVTQNAGSVMYFPFNWIPWNCLGIDKLVHKSITTFTNHDPNGVHPIDMIHRFPRAVPVLFVTSKVDKTVPMTCTLNMVQALRSTGHPNVHLIVLSNSDHPTYTMDCQLDKMRYEAMLHAVYKNYGIPYNPEKFGYNRENELFCECNSCTYDIECPEKMRDFYGKTPEQLVKMTLKEIETHNRL